MTAPTAGRGSARLGARGGPLAATAIALVLGLALSLGPSSPLAERARTAAAAPSTSTAPPRTPRADAAILMSGDGEILVSRAPDRRRAIASATKLMTALLALERSEPGRRFAAPAYRPAAGESKIGLRAGERMSVSDLLRALLLESANDAAVTIARGVSGSRRRFVAEMNARAEALGLDETHYANPIGLDHPDNYSSARDLADLARRLLRNPRFDGIVDRPAATLRTGDRTRTVRNRNILVGRSPIVDGIKTGHTADAGNVLVGSATGPGGVRIVSVVLGEPSEAARDEDTVALLRYGLSQFRRERALSTATPVARARIRYHGDDRAPLIPRSDYFTTLRRGQRLQTRVDAPGELDGPLKAGARVGSVTVLVDGRALKTVALVTAADVPGAGPLRVVTSALGVPLTVLLTLAGLGALALAGLRARVVYQKRTHTATGTQ